jgi:nitroreductase
MSSAELPNPLDYRKPEYPVDSLFLKRWSPRAMSGKPVAKDELMSLFEAARWAPSTYNEQEWRFVYAMRDTPAWDKLFGFLMEANQVWCKNAGVLILTCTRKTFVRNGKENPVCILDAGLALENLHLQATIMGLVAHSMAGFGRDMARRELAIPDVFDIQAMTAVGRPGDPSVLPEDVREREKPTTRKPFDQIVREGVFDFAE